MSALGHKRTSRESTRLGSHVDYPGEPYSEIGIGIRRSIPQSLLHHGNSQIPALGQARSFRSCQRGAEFFPGQVSAISWSTGLLAPGARQSPRIEPIKPRIADQLDATRPSPFVVCSDWNRNAARAA